MFNKKMYCGQIKKRVGIQCLEFVIQILKFATQPDSSPAPSCDLKKLKRNFLGLTFYTPLLHTHYKADDLMLI